VIAFQRSVAHKSFHFFDFCLNDVPQRVLTVLTVPDLVLRVPDLVLRQPADQQATWLFAKAFGSPH
jgi:hypothetical protein